MCLIVSRKQKPKIADKDIIVYKAMIDGKSASVDFEYIKGKLYKTEIRAGNNYRAADEISVSKLNNLCDDWNWNTDRWISYERGFHSYISFKRAKKANWYKAEIIKFIIPKGATYYRDITGCIVSNKIKML